MPSEISERSDAKYLLVGGGVASVSAAAAIRKADPHGSITILCAEPNPPTDRPPLSKQFLIDDSWTPQDPESKPPEFYEKNRIELRLGATAKSIDRGKRVVHLESGDSIRYERLLLATGSTPRRLDVPGADLDGVMTLRTVRDAVSLRSRLKSSRRVVMVGGGFVGMEVAAAASVRGLETVVVTSGLWPFATFVGAGFGGFMADLYRSHGVEFAFSDAVTSLEGADEVSAVYTREGRKFETDFVVVGVGADPNAGLAASAGLALASRDGVVVNEKLQTTDPSIWAAGDVAAYLDVLSGRRRRIEHFLNAKWQGTAAGESMAGAGKTFDRIPYAYSDVFDVHVNIRGDAGRTKSVRLLGDHAAGEFVELYIDESEVLRMTIAVSHDDDKLERVSDAAEALIRADAPAANLDRSTFGI